MFLDLNGDIDRFLMNFDKIKLVGLDRGENSITIVFVDGEIYTWEFKNQDEAEQMYNAITEFIKPAGEVLIPPHGSFAIKPAR
ncbi:hypothetical protein DRO45_04515 [Candidatus Bathyarchaeota archaeon]|nr:MAG: hypothetical protein DRN51_05700 [Thermococci archaeon]RLI19964.1 MAG: hypothetical protein DRO45_04515 [Candidatus Bathyarchaeota archaeon]